MSPTSTPSAAAVGALITASPTRVGQPPSMVSWSQTPAR